MHLCKVFYQEYPKIPIMSNFFKEETGHLKNVKNGVFFVLLQVFQFLKTNVNLQIMYHLISNKTPFF